jgi:hypothetical protein
MKCLGRQSASVMIAVAIHIVPFIYSFSNNSAKSDGAQWSRLRMQCHPVSLGTPSRVHPSLVLPGTSESRVCMAEMANGHGLVKGI